MPIHYRILTYRYTNRGRPSTELLQRALTRTQLTGWSPSPEWLPPTDVIETPEAVIIQLEIAGLREDEILIALYPNLITISGERLDQTPELGKARYHEAGIRYGPFQAEIALPVPIDNERVEASYDRGFLKVVLPKRR